MMFRPGSAEYDRATRPHNSVTSQHPAFVGVPRDGSEVAELVGEALARGLVVVPQATGHGAGAEVGPDTVLLDTSGLDSVAIDEDRGVATVGSGATWAAVNALAERHGLLAPAGSAPSVSVSGYTFAGGVGWLARRDGMASGALRRVDYVDGNAQQRLAAQDAADHLDQDALWAFRGAGGVGVATALELDLRPAADLHAGTLLWQATDLPEVVAAWAASLDEIGPSVSSSIAVLHAPPAPPIPEPLRGRVAVHLAVADPDGSDGAGPLLDAVRAAARPIMDTWGPADAAGLARIHLDPPDPAPAVGDARWLDQGAAALSVQLLSVAAGDDSPLVMLELRHVAGAPTRSAGATTAPAGPFIYHAVGAVGRSSRPQIEDGFARARSVWQPTDAGRSLGSWQEGAASVPESLPPHDRSRAAAIAARVDPQQVIRRSRLLG